jgi:hypothetical protein
MEVRSLITIKATCALEIRHHFSRPIRASCKPYVLGVLRECLWRLDETGATDGRRERRAQANGPK